MSAHPLVNLPFPLEGLAQTRDRRPLRNWNTAEDFSSVCFSTYSQCQIPYCYTYGLLYAGATQGELPEGQEKVPWGIPVLRNSLTRYTARHLRIRRLVQFIFADPIYHNALTNCAALLCRTQRRVARMCSSTLSVNCEKAEKDTLR